jgi:protein-L-isoaspartate(D-aspartate) O-methyltransferase
MKQFEDDPHYQKLRRRLVDGIREKGITSQRVLEAIFSIPRQFFMNTGQEKNAYIDKAFPIGEGQTISQPYTVAYQTQLLNVEPTDRVLEIGTGSAYQAAILASLASEVFTIERQKKLFERNKQFHYLETFYNLYFFYGDGYEGLPAYAPFDKILITAAAPQVPPKLTDQLKPGGCMVLPLGTAPVQRMVRITKSQDDKLYEEYFAGFSFVPMLEGKIE